MIIYLPLLMTVSTARYNLMLLCKKNRQTFQSTLRVTPNLERRNRVVEKHHDGREPIIGQW